MTEGLWAAIIGVGGTILGTVLGFFLGKIDFGKLKINVSSNQKTPYYNYGKMFEYREELVISLYNAANRNRVFRNAKAIFKDANNTKVLTISLKDLETIRNERYGIFIENIGTNNILPKAGLDIKAQLVIKEEELILAYQAKKVFLQYQNEKFKTKTIELWTCNLKRLAELLDEEQNNG